MAPTAAYTEPGTDECYRCGYLLHGITNDQACPECGLLAERSRRLTDVLHETRPKWLRGLFFGVVLILLTIPLTLAWSATIPTLVDALLTGIRWLSTVRRFEAGFVLIALVFYLGIALLTRPEGYEPADRADHPLRLLLRMAALIPFVVIAFPATQAELLAFQRRVHGLMYYSDALNWLDTAAIITATLGAVPLPLLLFLRLRGLAKRARSAHLAEHCLIVGIGTTLSLLYGFGLYELFDHAEQWGLDPNWSSHSTIALLSIAISIGLGCLFILWSIYLMVRFAIAFLHASRQLHRNWRRDDRSLETFKSETSNR